MSRGGADEEAALSPNSRLKLLCSYGGKILPRPSDGQLKYVGGETRVVSVPRSVTFKELKEKISGMFSNPDIVIKYQVFPEDLDALVSVRSDEDLHHMLEEYDRHETLPLSPSSSSRFRIFLFPCKNTTTPPSTSPTFLDAINGSLSIPIPSKPAMFTISSSACSSPPAMDSSPLNGFGLLGAAAKSGRPGMNRVRSSPNLGGWSLIQMGNSSSSVIGSPRGGGFYSPRHHQQHQYKGIMMGYGGGGGGTSRMGGSHRHETCGCGCGCMFSGHQSQRRYYYPPSGGAPCGCRGGHVEESHSPRSVHGSVNFSSGAGTPPIAPRRGIWEC